MSGRIVLIQANPQNPHSSMKYIKVSKNKIIIIPKFKDDSIGGFLKKLKFKNIVYLEINKQYQLN